MSSVSVVDIIIIAVLVLFAWRGAKKGLILSLFSLLALLVAFYGAKYVSTSFTAPVADILRPSIQMSINELLEGETPDTILSIAAQTAEAPEDSTSGAESAPVATDFSLKQILRLLDRADQFPGLREYLEEAVEEEAIEITSTAATAVASYLAKVAASALLFGLSFVVILLVWGLTGRALDLTFKLPILSAVNAIGGLLFGVVKAVVILLVLVWLGKLIGWITPENSGPVTGMMTLEKLSATLRELIAMAAAAAN